MHLTSNMAGTHPTDLEIAAFVDGSCSARELADIQIHLAACDGCRMLAVESSRVVATAPSRSWRSGWVWKAGAAALAAGLIISLVPLSRMRTGDILPVAGSTVERTSAADRRSTVRTLLPSENAVIKGDSVKFGWSGETGNSYRLIITDSTGGPVWNTVTRDTVVAFRTSAGLLTPGRYYWYVDALHADGSSATSGRNTFTIAPR